LKRDSQKPNLVFLHGWASHWTVFRSLQRAIGQGFNMRALALPGYDPITQGLSGRSPDRRDDVGALVNALAAQVTQDCVLVGWSLGAQVALAWAQRFPTQVKRLVLMGATPTFMQQSQWTPAVSASVMNQFATALRADPAGLLRRFTALQTRGEARAVRVAHQLRSALFTHPLPSLDVLEAGLALLRETDLRALLPRMIQPSLIIHGSGDAVVPIAAALALSENLPQARFVCINGAGHAPFLSDPHGVATLIREFLHESFPTPPSV